jgi:hypothetical protein
MGEFRVSLTDDQRASLREAARRANIAEDEFIIRAITVVAATYGVTIPPTPPSPIKRFSRSANPRGGRPKAPLPEMTNDQPGGTFPRICPFCGRAFRNDKFEAKYCSDVCKTRAENKRNYEKRKSKR